MSASIFIFCLLASVIWKGFVNDEVGIAVQFVCRPIAGKDGNYALLGGWCRMRWSRCVVGACRSTGSGGAKCGSDVVEAV